jgi:hypothetical protein
MLLLCYGNRVDSSCRGSEELFLTLQTKHVIVVVE